MKDFAPPCPICEGGHRSTYTGYFTIIDTRAFVISKGPREGETVKNRRILYPAKGSTIKILEELKKRYGSLVGRAFKVKRMSSEDPNCGRDFDMKGKVSLAKIKETKDANKPFDYKEVLKPLSEQELAAYGFGSAAVLAEGEAGGGEVNLADLV